MDFKSIWVREPNRTEEWMVQLDSSRMRIRPIWWKNILSYLTMTFIGSSQWTARSKWNVLNCVMHWNRNFMLGNNKWSSEHPFLSMDDDDESLISFDLSFSLLLPSPSHTRTHLYRIFWNLCEQKERKTKFISLFSSDIYSFIDFLKETWGYRSDYPTRRRIRTLSSFDFPLTFVACAFVPPDRIDSEDDQCVHPRSDHSRWSIFVIPSISSARFSDFACSPWGSNEGA